MSLQMIQPALHALFQSWFCLLYNHAKVLLESGNTECHIFDLVVKNYAISVFPQTPASSNQTFFKASMCILLPSLQEHFYEVMISVPLVANVHPEVLTEITAKNRCIKCSLGSSSHNSHLLVSMQKFFLFSRSLVFNLSCNKSQKKNFCFDKEHDFHIH